METVDTMNHELLRILSAKEARRRDLAAEPFPAKVQKLVCLQALAAPILRARGRQVRVWTLAQSLQDQNPASESSEAR